MDADLSLLIMHLISDLDGDVNSILDEPTTGMGTVENQESGFRFRLRLQPSPKSNGQTRPF